MPRNAPSKPSQKPSMPKPPKIPQSVLVIIHTPALEVLLIERADHAAFWQSVTGSKDRLDEPLVETAVREVAVFAIPHSTLGEEVAAAIVFLCTNAASYINGAAITVDGGQGGHV